MAGSRRRSGGRATGTRARAHHRGARRDGFVSIGLYAAGFAFSFAAPPLALGCAAILVVLWVFPDSRIDRLSAR